MRFFQKTPAVISAVCLFYFLASFFSTGLAGISFIVTLSIIPILYGLVSYLYGSQYKTAFIPYFIPPPPCAHSVGVIDNITLPMRYGNSVATEVVLKLFHYPVERKGFCCILAIACYLWEPCSGFRSLITLFSLGLVYVCTARALCLQRVYWFSIIPIALTGNFIRVLAICLITYYFGTEAGQGFFHKFSGILVFVITALGLAVFESVLNGQHNRKRKSNTNKEFESQGLSE